MAFFAAFSLVAQTPQGSRSTHPHFGGAWSSATAIPLERPAQLKDQPFYTPEQASRLQNKTHRADDDPLSRLETGSLMLPSLRTAIITDPPNGLLPSLTPSAAAAKRDRLERLHNPAEAKDMGLQDRCLVFPTSVAPMIPYRYNSNYQIVQTPDAVVVEAEMIHDARIIRLDRSSHLPSNAQGAGDLFLVEFLQAKCGAANIGGPTFGQLPDKAPGDPRTPTGFIGRKANLGRDFRLATGAHRNECIDSRRSPPLGPEIRPCRAGSS